ncbi:MULTISPECIES: hypothetical protein [Citrobacter freundii complex]|uniref:hypothetical protein n=1 Tax=Citrobacter freundii complex TaxID=1344959 RepID=UPI000650E5AE|nr:MULTISPECIES: hypothetical protein [Citrobacter freundii complex]EKV4359845.1 hypothetical protein [Citrobacter freundii]ELE2062785.1 hypothetical protein [Citrobacter freundii]ELK6675827.1 hypothetical protein [Citrobacter freundii]KLV84187.1 hypothetical protein SK37_01941 [Citrobacter sp. MGH109]MBN4827949.1 hypothetical protein [Citrobacter freundii]
MHRIDTPTAQVDKFGQGKNGFTNGDPATGRRATDLNSDMWDAVQEEVCTVIEQSGLTLNKAQHDQLYKAIMKLISNQIPAALLKKNNLSDLIDKAMARANLELGSAATRDVGVNRGNVMDVGAGGLLAGTFISGDADKTSIGARAATGCQFMRAHQAPDAPDQVSYWQIISLSEVVSPTSVVDVLAISGNLVLFGHGTGAGITSWRNVAMLEGAAFTGDISAPNMRSSTSVTVGDGTGGLAKGDFDGAGFNGNNLNIKSWNGIGFQCYSDDVIRAYISTKLGVIAAAENLQAGNAIFNKNGDVYGDIWNTGSGPGWLSAFLSTKPGRQYITQVGVYNNDKTKPFMLHDDDSGIFLATTDMLSGYVQSIRFGGVEQAAAWRAPGFTDQIGYVITGVTNANSDDYVDGVQRRLLQIKVNGQWFTVGA